MRSILTALVEMKESLSVQYEMILDNIKILRTKNSSIQNPAKLLTSISSKRKSKERKNIHEQAQNN